MTPTELFAVAVGTFVACRLWLTVNGMLDAIIQFALNGGEEDGEE